MSTNLRGICVGFVMFWLVCGTPVGAEDAGPNQQLEGFPGKISEAVVAHEPDLEAIALDAKRFGAQLPAEENLSQPPLFQTAAASDGLSRPT